MSRALKEGLEIILRAPRAMSAKDLEVRMSTPYENPRRLTAQLRSLGLITEVFRQAREKFYVATPGAVIPVWIGEDRRVENKTHIATAARRLRMKRRVR